MVWMFREGLTRSVLLATIFTQFNLHIEAKMLIVNEKND